MIRSKEDWRLVPRPTAGRTCDAPGQDRLNVLCLSAGRVFNRQVALSSGHPTVVGYGVNRLAPGLVVPQNRFDQRTGAATFMPDFSVLIVEDQARFRDAFVRSLAAVSDIELLGIAADLPQGMRMFDDLLPDVLLVDLDLPGGSGVELIRHAAQTRPACEVMVISVFGDEQHVLTSIEAGATGYLLKDSLALDLPSQLRTLRAGGSPISPLIARRLLSRLAPIAGQAAHSRQGGNAPDSVPTALPDDEVVALSEQESRVLHLAAKGFTFDEIAQFLQVSPHTVMTYVKRVYRKLHVRSKVEAIYEARRLGWLRD